MVRKTVAEINQYEGTTVNPIQFPEQVYELYSVPSFDTEYPEIIAGADIGSSKVTVQEGDVLICKINPRIEEVSSIIVNFAPETEVDSKSVVE